MKHSLLHSSLSVLIVAALGGSAAPAQSTTRVSVDSAGLQTKDGSQPPMISADGRFVTFSSHATNLVIGDTNGKFDVFVHDRRQARRRGCAWIPEASSATPDPEVVNAVETLFI